MTASTFQHEALIYGSADEFVSTVVPFLKEGLAEGDGAVVATNDLNIRRLRQALGRDADEVMMVPAKEVYTSPHGAVGAYHRVLEGFAKNGKPSVRAIGEVEYGSTAYENESWLRYEPVAHEVFSDARLKVICPYDKNALAPALIEHAVKTHPHIHRDSSREENPSFEDPRSVFSSLPVHFPLGCSTQPDIQLDLTAGRLADARRTIDALVARRFESVRDEEVTLAISEVTTNAIRYGSGSATVRLWNLSEHLVCEVRNEGRPIEDFAAGYRPPRPADHAEHGGMGLWIARHLADAMTIQSDESGPVVRLAFAYLSSGRRR